MILLQCFSVKTNIVICTGQADKKKIKMKTDSLEKCSCFMQKKIQEGK